MELAAAGRIPKVLVGVMYCSVFVYSDVLRPFVDDHRFSK
jgi:hypothetical protein